MRRLPVNNRQRGAVAVMVAVALVALIGMLGLVLDLGRLFVMKAELQNAADACALAAAQELDGTANALTRAQNAGILAGTRNRQNFQSAAVAVTAADISFSTTLSPNSNYQTQAAGAPVTSRFAMCTLRIANIPVTASSIVGVGPQAVQGQAVATLSASQANCALPIALCSAGAAPSFGFAAGQWLGANLGGQGNLTGNFGWIDFTPPAGGASELAASLTGTGVCNTAPATTLVGQTGAANSLVNDWNSRFGLYQNGAGNPQAGTAPPDYSGYSYNPTTWPAQANALANFLARRAVNAPFQGSNVPSNNATPIPNSEHPLTAAQHAAFGSNRRLAIAPIVNCAGWAGAQTVPLLNYACVLMLHPINKVNGGTIWLEYIGAANAPNTPCPTNGIPGGVGPLVPTLVQ